MSELNLSVLAQGDLETIKDHLIECGWTPPAEPLEGRRVLYGCKIGTVEDVSGRDMPMYRIRLDSGQALFLTRGSFELLP